jgi:predicted O-methyltransferase YrrM
MPDDDCCKTCGTDLQQNVKIGYPNGGSLVPLLECPVCGAETGRVDHGNATTPSIEPAASSYRSPPIKWIDDDHFQVGDTDFVLIIDSSTWEVSQSTFDRFVLLKTKHLLKSLLNLAPEHVENIFDLGIYKGGSVALYQALFSPRRLVGIDQLPDRVEALDQFIDRHSLDEVVRLYYGANQGDKELLARILREDFRDEPLDLVIDDCSHMYEFCRASLNVLLPRLRHGGLYVIEDWGWAHWPGEYWQGTSHAFVDEPTPLSKLILEIILVAASRPRLISEVTVQHSAIYVTRGDEVISDVAFDISQSYFTAGRQILCKPSAPS